MSALSSDINALTCSAQDALACLAQEGLACSTQDDASPAELEDRTEAARERVQIRSRRYLGAKTRLLPILEQVIAQELGAFSSLADLFAGTGVVGHHFNTPERRIIANDLLSANRVGLDCFLGTSQLDEGRIEDLLRALEALPCEDDNYFSEHFGNRFFTLETARRIGAMREALEQWEQAGALLPGERDVLLTSLLYAADRVANTCGHYDAYRPLGVSLPPLTLNFPAIPLEANQGNQIFQADANALVGTLDVDVLYIDPPYNSRQYSDTYHLLENLATWKKPPVSGKAQKMDRTGLKSRYCSLVDAQVAFRELIDAANARLIVVSYNNMGGKGAKRSQACLSDAVILEALARRGTVTLHEHAYPSFTARKTPILAHTERLFCCRVRT